MKGKKDPILKYIHTKLDYEFLPVRWVVGLGSSLFVCLFVFATLLFSCIIVNTVPDIDACAVSQTVCGISQLKQQL